MAAETNQSNHAKYKALRSLGFAQTAVNCYESLFEDGGTNMVELGRRLGKSPATLYRVAKQLEKKGLVTALKTTGQPTYFHAVPMDKALRQYIDYQWYVMEDLIDHQDATLARRSGRPRRYISRPTRRA